jgi:hypothetical protein
MMSCIVDANRRKEGSCRQDINRTQQIGDLFGWIKQKLYNALEDAGCHLSEVRFSQKSAIARGLDPKDHEVEWMASTRAMVIWLAVSAKNARNTVRSDEYRAILKDFVRVNSGNSFLGMDMSFPEDESMSLDDVVVEGMPNLCEDGVHLRSCQHVRSLEAIMAEDGVPSDWADFFHEVFVAAEHCHRCEERQLPIVLFPPAASYQPPQAPPGKHRKLRCFRAHG